MKKLLIIGPKNSSEKILKFFKIIETDLSLPFLEHFQIVLQEKINTLNTEQMTHFDLLIIECIKLGKTNGGQ